MKRLMRDNTRPRGELERAVSGVATNTIKQVNKAPVSTNKTGNLILGVY